MNQLLKSTTISSYEILTENLQKLMQVQNASEIFNLIGEGLHEIIPNSVIIINQVTNEETISTTKGIYRLKENIFYTAIEKL
ncbi:MAG: hypothetical protein C0599_09680 [Salinivirgaceae bacterium]|nr:MAG: hypothetical protein C0599_09680 [Salinivirgaceae bacterium]